MNAAVEAPVTSMAAAHDKLLCGLIGAGIQRSLTPAMQEEEARAQGLRLHYQLIDLDLRGRGTEAMPALLDAARTMGFAGLNITYPCKQAVIPLLDGLSDEARAMGAVNTVVHRDGRLVGHNTDGSGWHWGFQRLLPGLQFGDVDAVSQQPAVGQPFFDDAAPAAVGQLAHDREPFPVRQSVEQSRAAPQRRV